jgi:hypothetical protein
MPSKPMRQASVKTAAQPGGGTPQQPRQARLSVSQRHRPEVGDRRPGGWPPARCRYLLHYGLAIRQNEPAAVEPDARRDIQRADDDDSLREPLAFRKSGHLEHGQDDGACAPLHHGRSGAFSARAHGTAPQNHRFSFGRRGTPGLKSGRRRGQHRAKYRLDANCAVDRGRRNEGGLAGRHLRASEIISSSRTEARLEQIDFSDQLASDLV